MCPWLATLVQDQMQYSNVYLVPGVPGAGQPRHQPRHGEEGDRHHGRGRYQHTSTIISIVIVIVIVIIIVIIIIAIIIMIFLIIIIAIITIKTC